MKWRPLARLALLAAAIAGAAGCAANNEPPASPSASPTASTATSPPTATAGGEQAPNPATGENAPPSATVPPEASPSSAAPPSASEDPIRLKIRNMTPEEKIGQMVLAGIEGDELDDEAIKMIREHKIGGIILYGDNISDVRGTVSLINAIKRVNAGNPAPIFIGVDQEGGRVSRLPDEVEPFPASAAVGAGGKPEQAEEMGNLLAEALLAFGLNMDFAPVLDVNSNPDNPVIGDRSFGSSAERVAEMGIAAMKGIRGGGVIPVVKHFPGHGDTSVDSHLDLPVVNKTPQQLAKQEWLPFQAAVKEQAEAIMVAHILFPKVDPKRPASLSKTIVGTQLREKMGYDGVVMTDDLGMGAIVKNYKLADAAADAVEAGVDILLIGHGYDNERAVFESLVRCVKDGTIAETRIDESVYRILKLKERARLSDEETEAPDLDGLNARIRDWRGRIE
ncbi:beta-N-acetylhexosaminidase [Cohnella massiliensis]|uniref:beta-N-acetylhexosaminidase n=1 Tax=Cohnella massiliensis TaxID=1816691 RepID=UPI0009BB9B83|nr:beta-N-acetylhexosaminidase [Cohnella massiliensis]